jgi:tetratricopeptide (TPR) repeat protein
MRQFLIGLALVLAAMPAGAQTVDKNLSNCESKDIELSISGCSAMLQAKPAMIPKFRLAAYMTRGLRYHDKGLEEQAIADFTNAMALKPSADTLATLHAARGMAYYAKNLYPQSIADFSETIALKPDYADAYKLRGGAYQMNGQLDNAVADYRAALKLEPDAQAVKDVLKRLGAKP